jgi:hypothetical protein
MEDDTQPVERRRFARGSVRRLRPAIHRAGLLTLLLLPDCTLRYAAEPRPPVRSIAEIRHHLVVLQRWDLSCGAAALATLLTYDLGDPVSERAVAEAMLGRTDPLKVRVQGGFSLLDLQQYAVERGYAADGYGNVDLETLVGMAPAIVPVNFHGYDHFVVFRGIRRGRIILADPAFGVRTAAVRQFQRAWKQRVAFVVERRAPEGQ